MECIFRKAGISGFTGILCTIPVLGVIGLGQGQEGQRAVIGKALPGGLLVRFAAAHAGNDGVVRVIPFTGGAASQATHR